MNYAVACHRWTTGRCLLSMSVSVAAAIVGWQRTRRAADRYDDARLGDLLRWVEDPPTDTWSMHPAQVIKRQHAKHCLHRWGLTPRTSGWYSFRHSWKKDAASASVCLVVAVHAWWLAA